VVAEIINSVTWFKIQSSKSLSAFRKPFELLTLNFEQKSCSYQAGSFSFLTSAAIIIMSEDLRIISGTKQEQYEELIPQIKGLLDGETDLIANLANITAALKEQFGWLWVGFYLVKNNELVLAPFQGPVACTRIKKGRGVCGTSWQEARTLIVADVEKFPGHIACSSLSRSEIVVPLIHEDHVVGVLDIDSENLSEFDETDGNYLKQIVSLIKFS
jgi:L-methionine (R)-S-oxide reductase